MPDCSAIAFENVTFGYEAGVPVLQDLTFAVAEGELVAVQGDNGAGKSTVVKLVDAMLQPQTGAVSIFGMDTAEPSNLWAIRSSCGIVFQNPDDQLVATLVHDEVAFGPRNLGLPEDEVGARVKHALQAVGLEKLRDADVNALSGGQKQRVAIAGALAMEPRILLLDEATSMLDASAASEMIALVRRLRDQGMTIVLITHDPALASVADRVIRLGDTPEGPSSPSVGASGGFSSPSVGAHVPSGAPLSKKAAEPAIELEDVTFAYGEDAEPVLDGVSLAIRQGEFVALTGPNGSGKSTLLKHLNGLLQPTSGTVRILGQALDTKEARNQARRQVGLAFQHPEVQLFESTVYDDVAFGPRNLGLDSAEVEARVRQALNQVGLPFDEIYRRNPFTLSGGQQRRAALSGVLALRTPILTLDEPCAGLDVHSKRELLALLCRLNAEGTTIVMVTHSPDDAKTLGCRIIEM